MASRPSKRPAMQKQGTGKAAAPIGGGAGWYDPWSYWIDTAQRSILFWDVLRQRGNQAIELAQAGEPPVMAFRYQEVMDGRDLARPVNYQLLRLEPPARFAIDPAKRPYVVVEPRSGTRPGIAASRVASEVGVAMRAGHPVYLVSFRPEPEPGQTLEDVGHAQAAFLLRVTELHPEAEGKPAVVGNSQAGWAIMMLAAAAPELIGVVSIAGAPLSFWAGVEGQHPMRYQAGLVGGSWLVALLGDLGNGKFDGAHLVRGVELAHPAEAVWSVHARLYADVDRHAPAYLKQQKWWGGYFQTTKDEMRAIVDELFVGNNLTRGTISTSDRGPIDLRRIKAPIVIVASWGDSMTSPPQALYWIADLYRTDQEIVAQEQTIIYTLDDRIGHLDIFVSGKVAGKQHAGIATTLDLIDVLPPGLYEMILVEKKPQDLGSDLLPGQYLVHFESRSIGDILALGDGREHEQAFETVRGISALNGELYDRFVSPWVRLWSNEATAAAWRMANPTRFQRYLCSDLNPAMWPVKLMAEAVREQRRPVAADHPMAAMEGAACAAIEDALRAAAELQGRLQETWFKAIYNAPWVQAWARMGAPVPAEDDRGAAAFDQTLAEIAARNGAGGFDHALVRILLACAMAARTIDVRHFRLAQRIVDEYADFGEVGPAALKQLIREQAFLIAFDRVAALESLPKLLPAEQQRREVLGLAARIAAADGEISALHREVLDEIAGIFGLGGLAARA